jgi:hypothetical protein
MRAQVKYPYHSTILGLNNIYSTVGDDSFYINTDFILVRDKILTIGREYLILNLSTTPGNKMSDVLLVDCYYYEGIIHLILEDVRSHQLFTISQCLECQEWVLVDLNFFRDLQDTKAIRDYCGCGDNTEVAGHHNHPKVHEDLLDFEF